MNDAIILTLAYPETIVMVADEWYSPLLRYVGIGKKHYVRAGHAALVLIEKATGILEYHDFGRYITPEPFGRARGKRTDHELDFPLKAIIDGDAIVNLDEILQFLGTHPKLTHGDGTLYASVCKDIHYQSAKNHIFMMQERGFIKYAAFEKNACNCARFVTDTLTASTTNLQIKQRLINSKRLTPSTIGNVVIANTQPNVYQVSEKGEIAVFASNVNKLNRQLFLDRLASHQPNLIGTQLPKPNKVHASHAQWLSGIAAGAWFELYDLNHLEEFRFRRISPYGNVDVDGVYKVTLRGFTIHEPYKFIHYSNCHFFHMEQSGIVFRFEFLRLFK